MTSSEETLATFQTRVRQMILRYQQLREENEALRREVEGCKTQIDGMRDSLTREVEDHNALKMAKLLEVTDGDIERSRARLARLIRDINKCIAILSEQK